MSEEETEVIQKYETVKGMVVRVLREREDARNSQEWTCHLVQKSCAQKYFSKELQDLSKEERLALPRRSTVARAMRQVQNNMEKFQANEEVQLSRKVKERALHKHFSS